MDNKESICLCFLDKNQKEKRILSSKMESLIRQFQGEGEIKKIVADELVKTNNDEWFEFKFKNPSKDFISFLSKQRIELKSCPCNDYKL